MLIAHRYGVAPVEWGVTYDWRGLTADSAIRLSQVAEAAGASRSFIPEAWSTDALVVSALVLRSTNTIKVGTGVINVFSRSAALIGMAAATLDQASDGRFFLGLGTSARALVEDWYGTSFSSPVKRLEVYTASVRRVASGLPYSPHGMEGRFKLFTEPARSSLEIFIAALGDSMLERAGRSSDGAVVTLYPLSRIERAARLVSASGKNKKVFMYIPFIPSSLAEHGAIISEAKKTIAFYISSMGDYYSSLVAKHGFEREVERIRKAHSTGGRKAAAEEVSDQLLSELTLLGGREEVKRKLNDLPREVVPVIMLSPRTIPYDVLQKVIREFALVSGEVE